MSKNIGMQVEFPCLCKRISCNTLQFRQSKMTLMDQEDNVIEIGVETSVEFAERNAVWVGNVHIQIPKLTDEDTAFLASRRQGNKAFNGNGFDENLQVFRRLQDDSMQFVGMNIVAHEVNIKGLARTSQQCKRTSTDQCQVRFGRDTFPKRQKYGLDLGIIHVSIPIL